MLFISCNCVASIVFTLLVSVFICVCVTMAKCVFKKPSVTVQRHLKYFNRCLHVCGWVFSTQKHKKSNCKKLQKPCALHALATEYWAKGESCQPSMKYQARRQNKEVLIVTDVPLLQLFFSPFSSQSLSVSNFFFPTTNTIHLYTKMPFAPPPFLSSYWILWRCAATHRS